MIGARLPMPALRHPGHRGNSTGYLKHTTPPDYDRQRRPCPRPTLRGRAFRRFLQERVFGPDRAAMLADQLPATDAEAARQAETQATALRQQITRAETAEHALTTELETLGTDTSPATTAYRARIRERFTQLYNQRTQAQNELAELTATAPDTPDPALLDELPDALALLSEAPAHIREHLYDALDIQILYRHEKQQATIWATLTDATPDAIQQLLTDPRTDTDTTTSNYPDPFRKSGELPPAPIATKSANFLGADQPQAAPWSGQRPAVANLGDWEALAVICLCRPVGNPARLRVEPTGAGVAVQHPQHRVGEPVGCQSLNRRRHEPPSGAGAPRLRQGVDGEHLAGFVRVRVVVSRRAERYEARDGRVVRGNKNAGSGGQVAQLSAPARGAAGRVETVKVLLRHQPEICALPGPHVDQSDLFCVALTRGTNRDICHADMVESPVLSAQPD